MSCPFCPLEKFTEWFAESPDGIVVCEDLDPKGYKYRILVVKPGQENHRPKERYSENERQQLRDILYVVVSAHEREGKGKLVGIDEEHFSIKSHYHIQGLMGEI